ncbi:amino acid adenylation domain-containing protein [Burkholderia alba]|uniref:amino acid adenylation domain-containing protein n=1 Tax=Burkholderia alba TaxID=2683677 RepID=UPI002B0547E1|nr:amino acid adenylation domain-containing protein [Burkholderia alba]
MNDSKTVLDSVNQWSERTPDAVALSTQDDSVSYRELATDSDAIAACLSGRGIGPGHIVPIIATRSTDFIVGLLGIMKTGAAYSPIDHAYPEQRRAYIVGQTGSPLTLTTAPDDPGTDGAVASVAALRRTPSASARRPGSRPSPDDPIYVIFTSGTTGVPKGVVVEHRSVASLLAWYTETFEVDGTSRSTLVAALGFDVAHWEIWSPLCAGATLCLPDDETRRDVDALLQFFERERITHAFVPTVMVRDVVAASRPGPSSLRYLVTGGEKLMPLDTDHLGYRLFDCYGPTEATIWATYHPVPSARLGRPPSIGKPVGDTRIWILDAGLREPPAGEIGEIFIGGSCLARGYLHDEQRTREKFLQHPSVRGARIYRTGDLGRWLPDGSLQFLGRTDEQVKIRGHLVELTEVEIALARQRGVRQASVAATSPAVGDARSIVAFIVPERRTEPEREFVGRLRDDIGAFLPDYMMPGRYLLLDAFPANANGKTDKAALLAALAERDARAAARDFSEIGDPVRRALFEAFAAALGHADFRADDRFFDVGGHSLRAASVVTRLSARIHLSIRISDLYNHPTVDGLAAEIARRRDVGGETSDRLSPEMLRRDAALPADILFDTPFDPARLASPRHVLLTGATGFVGIHLLAELLATTDAVIHCIVRAADRAEAERRIDAKIREYQVGIDAPSRARVKLHVGDLAMPDFGIARSDYAALSRDIDVIHHSASSVNFIKPYGAMKQDNVDALVNLIRFAAAGRTKAMMMLSTISVYSWGHRITGKDTMREDDDIDQNLDAVCSDIGYVKSKWVMEKIADLAGSRGMPLMTFRLGYATYHSRTGLSAGYQWWGRLVKTCIALGAVPDLQALHEGLSSVDYMTRSIAHISRKPAAIGRKFNLIHSGASDVSLQDFFTRLERHFGFAFSRLPFRTWRDLWSHHADTPLYPLLNLFRDRMHDDRCVIELYEHTYHWRHDNTSAFLEGSGILPPNFDEPELRRYLERSIGITPA